MGILAQNSPDMFGEEPRTAISHRNLEKWAG
jgi:hypothetical protein